MNTYKIDTDATFREECPGCRSQNIKGLGFEVSFEDVQPVIYDIAECCNCGVLWKDRYEHTEIEFDESNMVNYD